MLDKYDVALYFMSLDPERDIFNVNLVERNGARFYEGNAKLNKFMHLAQNIYLAKTGELLIDADFYAYSNGAVIPAIQKDYRVLLNRAVSTYNIPDEMALFLQKIFVAFKNADIDEIIDIDYEDSAWIEKQNQTDYGNQKMDTIAHMEEYKKQYADMIKVLDRMEL